MKRILIVFIILCTLNLNAQTKVELSLQQDLRLLTVGDEKGNDPLTANLLSRLEVPVYQLEKHHIASYLSVEYADLAVKNYQRYALGAGYVIDKVCGKIGAGAYADFGKIYREKESFNSFSISGEMNFKLTDNLKIICTQQFTQRKDLKVLYNAKREFIISGFIGFKYSF